MRWCVTVAVLLYSFAAAAQTPGPAPKKVTGSTASPPAEAPVSADPQLTSASYGDWVLVCQKLAAAPGKVCEISHAVQVQGQPAPITKLAVAKDKADRRWRLTVVLPTNVSLQKVPKIEPDEKDAAGGIDTTWVRCLPGACFATAALTEDVLKAWRGASARGRVTFQDGLGQDVALPFSMRGFAQALDALTKQ
jgi:invasion protein IalB